MVSATDQITLGNGSNDVLELTARSIVTSAHEVIYSENAFIVYHLATHSIGATSCRHTHKESQA